MLDALGTKFIPPHKKDLGTLGVKISAAFKQLSVIM